jgi:hypothetical protein
MQDKEDAKFAVDQGLDYICLSFVQTADDVDELRTYMKVSLSLSSLWLAQPIIGARKRGINPSRQSVKDSETRLLGPQAAIDHF